MGTRSVAASFAKITDASASPPARSLETWKLPSLRSLYTTAALFLLGALLWVLAPMPEGLNPAAWHLFIVFLTTIIGLILQPYPLSVVALAGIVVCLLTKLLSPAQALSGFASPVMWMIVVAILISRAIIKSGLGRRIAYSFIALLGRNAIGVAYGLGLTDLVLAPATPSAMARGGAIVLPILTAVSSAYGSEPKSPTAGRIGKYLTLTAAHMNAATGAMFLTGMAANPLMVGFAEKFGVSISWMTWFLYALVPGVISVLLLPLVCYLVSPPEIGHTPQAAEDAKAHLREMGPPTMHERLVFGVIVLLIVLWTAGDYFFAINSTTTAIVGLLCLILLGALDWSDVIGERSAWDTLIWFACVLTMANFLNSLGFIPWFSKSVAGAVGAYSWPVAFVALALVYFYSHYFFASLTSHVAAMYAAFVGTAVAVGVPPVLGVMVLAFLSSYFATVTHYGGSAPTLLFAQGYFRTGEWWRKNFVMSLFNLTVWIGVASFWLKFLGAW